MIVGAGMSNVPKDIGAGPFDYAEQNDFLKVLTWVRLKNEWTWEKDCLPSNVFLLLKRALELLILNRISSFKMFNDIYSY